MLYQDPNRYTRDPLAPNPLAPVGSLWLPSECSIRIQIRIRGIRWLPIRRWLPLAPKRVVYQDPNPYTRDPLAPNPLAPVGSPWLPSEWSIRIHIGIREIRWPPIRWLPLAPSVELPKLIDVDSENEHSELKA